MRRRPDEQGWIDGSVSLRERASEGSWRVEKGKCALCEKEDGRRSEGVVVFMRGRKRREWGFARRGDTIPEAGSTRPEAARRGHFTGTVLQPQSFARLAA